MFFNYELFCTYLLEFEEKNYYYVDLTFKFFNLIFLVLFFIFCEGDQ